MVGSGRPAAPVGRHGAGADAAGREVKEVVERLGDGDDELGGGESYYDR